MPIEWSFPRAIVNFRIKYQVPGSHSAAIWFPSVNSKSKVQESRQSTMVETPLTPLNPFAESPQELTASASAEAMARVFSFTPPTVFSAAGGGPTTAAAGTVFSSIQIRSHFHSHTGSLYTTGLNAQGFPELIAQGVPRHRAPLVVKNMHFLAGRMFHGIPVQGGHRSTDHDYRVAISDGPSHTLILLPFYHDCEEWGSFPPAPKQERTRRNRLLAAAWFPTNNDTYDATDAAYLVEHVEHFARLLQLPDLARINATMPISLQQLVHGQIARARTITMISMMPPSSSSSSSATTTTSTNCSMQNFPAASPLAKRSVPLQDQSNNMPQKRPTTTTTAQQKKPAPASSQQQQIQPRRQESCPRTCHIVGARSTILPSSSSTPPRASTTSSTMTTHHKTKQNKKINTNVVVAATVIHEDSRHHGRGMIDKNDNKSWSTAPCHDYVHSWSQTTRDTHGSPSNKKARAATRDSRVSVLRVQDEK